VKHKALVVAGKETSLDVYVAKTKYMVMSRDQNAGQNHNINIDNKNPLKRWNSSHIW